MAKYTFTLVEGDVSTPRSLHEDTDYVVAALSVNGQIVNIPQIKFIGNQGKGKFPIGFTWTDVDVLETEDAKVVLWYHILNRGGEHSAELEQTLVDMAKNKTRKVDAVGTVVDVAIAILKRLLSGRCDGPITPNEGRTIEWHMFELKAIAPGSKVEDKIVEPGSDSASGCGDNSRYTVHFTVAAS